MASCRTPHDESPRLVASNLGRRRHWKVTSSTVMSKSLFATFTPKTMAAASFAMLKPGIAACICPTPKGGGINSENMTVTVDSVEVGVKTLRKLEPSIALTASSEMMPKMMGVAFGELILKLALVYFAERSTQLTMPGPLEAI